jgi:thiamine biosynthesis lipoprotein
MREVLIPVDAPLRRISRPAPGGAVHALAGETMGTSWSVKLVERPDARAGRIEQRVQCILDRVVGQMSPWREDSDLCRFNRAAPGSWVRLPEEMFAVLAYALDVARATNGAFDPTLGALVNGWGFGPSPPGPALPDDGSVRRWLAHCGWRRIELDHQQRLARQDGGISLELGAIAKGYSVDLVARELDRLGWNHYLVEVGGELRGNGLKPDASPWWVELELPPGAHGLLPQSIVALESFSVATSGDYRRYYEVDGRRYAHTIDPHTGYPEDRGIASVTVVSRDCMAADAWSTALTVMGVQAGLALADRLGLAARFLCRNPAAWTLHASNAWLEMLGC